MSTNWYSPGPVFLKEVVEIARRRRYFVTRVLYASALLLVLGLAWEESLYARARFGLINSMAHLAATLFAWAGALQIAAIFLFVPMFLCGVIAGEREEHTLDLIFTTHLTNREIVLGKLGSRLAAMLALILSGLPVLSMVLHYGGVAPESLWRVLAATLAILLFVAAHSIYFSTVTASTLAALVRTYWWLGIWIVGVPLAVELTLELYRPWRMYRQPISAVQAFINPIWHAGMALDDYAYGGMVRYLGAWFFPASLCAPAAWSVFLVWRATRRLRQPPTPALAWVKRLRMVRHVRDWWHRPERLARRRHAAHTFWHGRAIDNPHWLRSRLAPVYDRTGHLGLAQWAGCGVMALILILIAIFESRNLRDEEAAMGFLGPTWLALAALIALVSATSFVGDRRRGLLELTLVTPLTGREIAMGTYLAVWEHVRPLIWLLLVLSIIFSLTGASPVLGVIASLTTAALFCLVLAGYGIICSLAARTLPAALTATFALPVAALCGTPLLMELFGQFHGPALWIITAGWFAGSWWWVRRRRRIASVAAYLLAMHFALIAVATCWTFSGRPQQFPVTALHPGVLVVALLDDRPANWFRASDWVAFVPCYWAALVANLIWMRRWLIRHFDELAERT